MNNKIMPFIALLVLMGTIVFFAIVIAGHSFVLRQAGAAIYMYIPMAAALIVNIKEPACLRSLFNINRYILYAIIAAVAVFLLSSILSLLFPGIDYSNTMKGYFDRYESAGSGSLLMRMQMMPIHPFVAASAVAFFAGITIHSFLAVGEEYGWRGFIYNELHSRGFWKCSLTTGLVWGIWEIPMVLLGRYYKTNYTEGIIVIVLWCLAASPVMNYIRERSKSIIPTIIFLGLLNAFQPVTAIMLSSSYEIYAGIRGLAGVAVFLVFDLLLLVRLRISDKKR